MDVENPDRRLSLFFVTASKLSQTARISPVLSNIIAKCSQMRFFLQTGSGSVGIQGCLVLGRPQEAPCIHIGLMVADIMSVYQLISASNRNFPLNKSSQGAQTRSPGEQVPPADGAAGRTAWRRGGTYSHKIVLYGSSLMPVRDWACSMIDKIHPQTT